MTYKLLQLKKENMRNYGFMDYDFALEHGFNEKDYEIVYEGEIDKHNLFSTYEVLEALFEKFNCNRPEDFKGHSMSVSDIVVLDGTKFYCDSFGFRKID